MYSEKYERILYNDPALKINWKLKNSVIKLSSKDQNLPEMKNTDFSLMQKDFMNNVLVCGCNGQLGSEIRFLSKKDIENRYFLPILTN